MAKSRIGALLGVLALALAPTAASAQSCANLRWELNQNAQNHLNLATDFPRTHLAILGCLLGNDRADDREGCAAAVVLVACGFMTQSECQDLVGRWARARLTYFWIAAQMRDLGCEQ